MGFTRGTSPWSVIAVLANWLKSGRMVAASEYPASVVSYVISGTQPIETISDCSGRMSSMLFVRWSRRTVSNLVRWHVSCSVVGGGNMDAQHEFIVVPTAAFVWTHGSRDYTDNIRRCVGFDQAMANHGPADDIRSGAPGNAVYGDAHQHTPNCPNHRAFTCSLLWGNGYEPVRMPLRMDTRRAS